MTAKENTSLERMEVSFSEFLIKQEARDKQLDSIHRALYGDPENEIVGLVKRQKNDDDWKIKVNSVLDDIYPEVKSFAKFKTKVKNTLLISGGTIGTGAGVGGVAFWDKIKSMLSVLFS